MKTLLILHAELKSPSIGELCNQTFRKHREMRDDLVFCLFFLSKANCLFLDLYSNNVNMIMIYTMIVKYTTTILRYYVKSIALYESTTTS